MRNRHRMVYLSMLCSLLLAACEDGRGSRGGSMGSMGSMGSGGSEGGGGGGPEITVPPIPPSPPPSYASYATYGEWNRGIRNAFPALARCTAGCAFVIPEGPTEIRSPFGETAAFDPAVDQWTATWTGQIEGYRHTDPDDVGVGLDRRWTGTAKLRIEAAQASEVRFWGENMRYDLEAGGRSGTGPDLGQGPPDGPVSPVSPDTAWVATLSTAIGEKGYFSGNGVHGQFEAAEAGTTPSRAIGHIQKAGHTGVFEVSR